jgi:TonB family protein
VMVIGTIMAGTLLGAGGSGDRRGSPPPFSWEGMKGRVVAFDPMNPQSLKTQISEGSATLKKGTMKMRIFEGSAETAIPQSKTVMSSYLQHSRTVTVDSGDSLDVQSRRIRDIFNLKSVALLTETDLLWERGNLEESFQIFRIEEKIYLIRVQPADITQRKFRIRVIEQYDGAKTDLLDTEVGLPTNISTVFGFRNVQEKPYFISLQILDWAVVPGPIQVTVTGPNRPEDRVSEEGPVRAIGDIKPPNLLSQVRPRYPEIARQARVDGIVILEAATDVFGRVSSLKILRSIPLLDQAAVEAVRQWVYEPMIVNGKPRGCVFTVTVRFSLSEGTPRPLAAITLLPLDGGEILSITKSVQPAYPQEALTAMAEGTVILEAAVDERGTVLNIRILRSVHPSLDKAAGDALKQWRFEPPPAGGKPKAVTVIANARFQLNSSTRTGGRVGGVVGGIVGGVEGGVDSLRGGDVQSKARFSPQEYTEGNALPEVRAIGDIQPPVLVFRVEPNYPEKARQARVEGTVILEATTDAYGHIASVKILRSNPLLDQAAIESVRQWVYEPLVIEGQPRKGVFTVTVKFILQSP